MGMTCPLAFLRALEQVDACFSDSTRLSVADIAARAGVRIDICAAAIATLAHSGLLKWDEDAVVRGETMVRIQRRTA